MKLLLSVLLSIIIASAFTGCKQMKSSPVKGKMLTVQDFKDVQKSIGPFSPFDTGLKKAVAKLGKPHKTDGRRSYWYSLDDKACTEFLIEELGGNMIGGVGITSMKPGTYMYHNCPAGKPAK
jgi:hypothetical protein